MTHNKFTNQTIEEEKKKSLNELNEGISGYVTANRKYIVTYTNDFSMKKFLNQTLCENNTIQMLSQQM